MSHAYSRTLRGVIASGLLLLTAASAGVAQWVTAPSVPQARTFAAVCASTDKVFAFGGSLDGKIGPTGIPGTATNTAWVLNTSGSSWTQLAAMPSNRTAGYAAYVNNKVYILGGISYVTSGTTTTRAWAANVLEYDPLLNSYTSKASMPIPVFGFAGAVVGNKIYVMGGIQQNGTGFAFPKAVQIYDVTTNTWSQSANEAPYASIYGSACGIGQNLYLVAGVDPNNNFTSSQLAYKGAVSANGIIWTQIANYPAAVSGHAGGTLNNKPYFAGGQDDNESITRACNYYDEASSSWKAGYGLPVALCHNSTMAYDGTWMYYVSGSNGSKVTYKIKEGPAQAVAEISPTNFVLTTKTGQTAQVKINVSNWGIAPLNGSIDIPAASQAWLNTPNGSFTNIAPGTTQQLTLNVGGASVNEGNYTAQVTVHTSDPSHADNTVTVNLYVRNELPAQPTVVVMEESSGAWCGPCGAYGVPEVRRLNQVYGEELITIAYHDRGGRGATADTLATSETEGIGGRLGVPYFPAAAVNRYLFAGQTGLMFGTTDWSPAIEAVRTNVPNAPITLDVKNFKYDTTTKTITATLDMTTAQAFQVGANGATVRVTGVVLEDSIKYSQASQADPFHHMHVARSFWPGIDGKDVTLPEGAVQDNILLPGTTMTTEVSYVVPKFANWRQCHMVFFVHLNYGNAFGPIMQGAELKFTDGVKKTDTGTGSGVDYFTTGANGMRLSQNTPNPASTVTSFNYDLPSAGVVSVEVFNLNGEKMFANSFGNVEAGSHNFGLNVSALPSGMYSVRLSSNGVGVTRMITVTR